MSNLFQRLSRTATRVELLNLVNSQPFSLIYRRRFLFIIGIIAGLCLFATVVCVTAVIGGRTADYNKATRKD